MQLLWIPKLSKEENFWLHYLTNQLSDIQQAEELIRKYSENKDNHLYKSVMDIIVRANRTKFEEAKNMCEALEELMEDELLEREKRGMDKDWSVDSSGVWRKDLKRLFRTISKKTSLRNASSRNL